MSETELAFPRPIVKPAKCKRCGAEFQQKYMYIAKEWHPMNLDYCADCLKKWEEYQKNLQAKEKPIDYNSAKREEWRKLRIPAKYLTKNFDNFNTKGGNLKAIHLACIKYANEFPFAYKKYVADHQQAYSSLMLSSLVGMGKTHLACAVGHKILDNWQGENIPCPIYFISEHEIYRRIINTYSYSQDEKINNPSENDIIDYLVKVPVLILDDLGKAERNDPRFINRIMFEVIDGRYRIQRPLIVTTNKSTDELATYLGDGSESACLSRLLEMCKGNNWQINADGDYRVK